MAGKGSKELDWINNVEDTLLQFGQEFTVHKRTCKNISFSADIGGAEHKDYLEVYPKLRKGKCIEKLAR